MEGLTYPRELSQEGQKKVNEVPGVRVNVFVDDDDD